MHGMTMGLLDGLSFPTPYVVPIFDVPFALVAMGVGYLCLERHRLRQDVRSAALGITLALTSLLTLAHVIAQPEHAGIIRFGAGAAPTLFVLSYIVALTGVGLANRWGDRPLPLTTATRIAIAVGVLTLAAIVVAGLVELEPALAFFVRSGRLTAAGACLAAVVTGAVGLWALQGFRRWRRARGGEVSGPAFVAAFIWLIGLVGFLLAPERYGLGWYIAGFARPVGVGLIFVGLLREQVWLYGEARARLRDLEALHRAGHALVTSLDPDATTAAIPTGARELMRADAAIFFRFDAEARVLRAVAGAGRISAELVSRLELSVGEGASGAAVARRAPVWSADLDGDEIRYPEAVRLRMQDEQLDAELAVPLLSPSGEVFGALSVFHEAGRAFADADLEMLSAFGTQASVAIENARVFERLALRARHDAALQDFAQRLLETTDEQAILRGAAAFTRELTGADLVGVLVHDARGDCLRLAAGIGWNPGTVGEVTVAPSAEAVAGYAFLRRELVEVKDLTKEWRFQADAYLREHAVRAGLVIPMGVKGQPAGVLGAYYRTPHRPSAEETRVLTSLAHQTALALGRSRLYAELQEYLAQLQETQAQLIQADKMKAMGTLLSGVAHELNNPLSTIHLSAQLLQRRSDLPEPVVERLGAIEDECERACRIVNDLLVFARRRPAERRPIDLNDVIRASLTLQARQFELSSIRVATELTPVQAVSADAHQMQQVLINLFGNAAQAMKSAHGRGVLTVRSAMEDGQVRIVVEDDGPGIPEEHLARIFDPFFTTKGVGEGTGLGLSLSIGLVEAHEGRLTVENVPGAGARFTITLPVADVETLPSAPVAAAAPAPARRARVLVVDDEPRLRRLLVEVLRGGGHDVEEAATGQEALSRLQNGTYDCVIMDLRLPDVDGRTIWQWLVEHKPALALKLAFMTGDTMSAETERFLAETARPVLTKPFPIDRIGRVLEEISGGS
jgi:signal transduction histidine kinase/ActR/RegA family two-component response regulator